MADVPARCPWCGLKHDEHGGQDESSTPQPGDISVCTGCLGVGIFILAVNGLAIRRANRAEILVMRQNRQFVSGLETLWNHFGRPTSEAIDAWRNYETETTEETENP